MRCGHWRGISCAALESVLDGEPSPCQEFAAAAVQERELPLTQPA
jgi:hypothetical protein